MCQATNISFFKYAFRHPDFIGTIRTISQCQALVRGIDSSKRKIPLSSDHIRSGVLVPLIERNGQTHLLFTRRAESLRHHKGEIAFPGGQWDNSDPSLTDTVLRETFEEIGISSMHVQILAELDDVITPYHYHVTPFVGWLNNSPSLKLNSEEVSEIIELPLAGFFNHEWYCFGYRYYQNVLYPIHSFYCKGYRIWGITGKIVFNFLNALIHSHNLKK